MHSYGTKSIVLHRKCRVDYIGDIIGQDPVEWLVEVRIYGLQIYKEEKLVTTYILANLCYLFNVFTSMSSKVMGLLSNIL